MVVETDLVQKQVETDFTDEILNWNKTAEFILADLGELFVLETILELTLYILY